MARWKGANKVDKNQKKIVQHIKALGGYVIDISSVNEAFDLLAAYRGQLYAFEVKNPEVIQKYVRGENGLVKLSEEEARVLALTEGEKKCKTEIERRGVKYHIVVNIEDVTKIFTSSFKRGGAK
jgi:hypothetical protein